MLTKKIFLYVMSAFMLTSFSSFYVSDNEDKEVKATFSIVTLHKAFTSGGITYNVYVDYNTTTLSVVHVEVFTNDCVECEVTNYTSTTFTKTQGMFNWLTVDSMTVTTTCGTFVISGPVIAQLNWC